jgi:hypothetical protein
LYSYVNKVRPILARLAYVLCCLCGTVACCPATKSKGQILVSEFQNFTNLPSELWLCLCPFGQRPEGAYLYYFVKTKNKNNPTFALAACLHLSKRGQPQARLRPGVIGGSLKKGDFLCLILFLNLIKIFLCKFSRYCETHLIKEVVNSET